MTEFATPTLGLRLSGIPIGALADVVPRLAELEERWGRGPPLSGPSSPTFGGEYAWTDGRLWKMGCPGEKVVEPN